MIINFNKKVIEHHGLTEGELLYMLIIEHNIDLNKTLESLITKGYASKKYSSPGVPDGYFLTRPALGVLENIVADSITDSPLSEEALIELAIQLREVFPKGKKDGTNYYWVEGIPLIVRRLKLFFKKYSTTYSPEEIVMAAKKYVESFNGQYKYMKLLKYFIFKEKKGDGGEIEGESELINYIDNAGQEKLLKDDWTSTLK